MLNAPAMANADIDQLAIEAEAALLAALIDDPRRVQQVAGWLRPSDLADDLHARIYEVMIERRSLREAARGWPKDWRKYAAGLCRAMVSEDVAHYGRIILAGRRRRLIAEAAEIGEALDAAA